MKRVRAVRVSQKKKKNTHTPREPRTFLRLLFVHRENRQFMFLNKEIF